MSLPKNNSSIINQIEIAALVDFRRNSVLEKGEAIEKKGNRIISKYPSKVGKPINSLYINCFFYDKKKKTIELIENLF